MRTLDEIITELLDIDRRINRLGFIYFGKAGFNSLQPRHPRGTREGGRWRADGDVSTPSNISRIFSNSANASDYPQPGVRGSMPKVPDVSIESTKITVPGSDGRPVNRVNIFVGGAADDTQSIVKNSNSYNHNTYGDNYYASHLDERGFLFATNKINKFIEKLPRDTEVNLIGHSWGGDSAAKISLDNPGRINMLVTIDPTSWSWPDFKKVKNSVNKWVNVNALGKRGEVTMGRGLAFFGDSWDSNPKNHAHTYIEAPISHDFFDSLMIYKTPKELSAQDILNIR